MIRIKSIDVINIDELYALCIAGAKVLHPRAALAAKRYSFPMRILSSFADVAGTIVEIKETNMESKLITAITSNKNRHKQKKEMFMSQGKAIDLKALRLLKRLKGNMTRYHVFLKLIQPLFNSMDSPLKHAGIIMVGIQKQRELRGEATQIPRGIPSVTISGTL